MEKRILAYGAIDITIGSVPIILSALILQDLTLIYYGAMIGGMLVVVFSFTVSFPTGLEQRNGNPTLTDLVHSLRLKGLLTEERPKSLTVHLDRWTAIDMRYNVTEKGASLKYRLDGTPSTLALVIFLFFGLISGVLAIPICIYLLVRADQYARRSVIPTLISSSNETHAPREEIKGLLIDGLSESRRLAEEGYRAANSAYEDRILIAIVVLGMVGWLVLMSVLSLSPLFDVSYRLAASALLALPISTALCGATIFLIMRRMRPRIIAMRQWVVRLDQGLSKELTGRIMEGDESSIELLFSAYDEMPKWLSARRKNLLGRYPATTILLVFMALSGASLIFSGLFSFLAVDSGFALISTTAGAMLVGGALWLERWIVKWQSAEETRTAEEWQRRRERLQEMIDLHLEGKEVG